MPQLKHSVVHCSNADAAVSQREVLSEVEYIRQILCAYLTLIQSDERSCCCLLISPKGSKPRTKTNVRNACFLSCELKAVGSELTVLFEQVCGKS